MGGGSVKYRPPISVQIKCIFFLLLLQSTSGFVIYSTRCALPLLPFVGLCEFLHVSEVLVALRSELQAGSIAAAEASSSNADDGDDD